MELKSRQTIILHKLFENGELTDSEKLQKELKIAKRTFYYDIEHINDWLVQNHLHQVTMSNGRIGVSLDDKKKIDTLLKTENNYFLSITERNSVIILTIALNNKPITIQYIMELFDISKNTVLKSLKQIKEELEEVNLNLVYRPKMGYLIEGEETTVRKIIWKQLYKMSTSIGLVLVRKLLQSTLEELTKDEIDFYELCRCIIKQYEMDAQINCFIGDSGYEYMMVQVAWIRNLKGYECEMSEEERFILMNTESYQSIEKNVMKMHIQGIAFPKREIYYVTSIFLGIDSTSQQTPEEEDAYIYNIVQKFVRSFSCIACINITETERLCKTLMHHMRPLFYRMKYGVLSQNILVKDVRRMYPDVFDFTERAAIDAGLNGISEDEIASLCVYLIGCFDEKRIRKSEVEPSKILIVSSDSVSKARLVKEQLQKAFGWEFVCDIIPKNQLKKMDLTEYVLIVAIEKFEERYRNSNLVVIDPILQEGSLNAIAEHLVTHILQNSYDSTIQDILDLIKTTEGLGNVDQAVYSRLYFKLFRYFSEQYSIKGELTGEKSRNKIENKIKTWWIQDGSDWLKAILFGGEKLQEGHENSHLVERLWNLMRNNMLQCYRFNEQMVIVHCPMHGEKNMDVSAHVLLNEEGIECPDGKSANAIVCLATVNTYSHWRLLYEIYMYFSVEENYRKLMKMDEE